MEPKMKRFQTYYEDLTVDLRMLGGKPTNLEMDLIDCYEFTSVVDNPTVPVVNHRLKNPEAFIALLRDCELTSFILAYSDDLFFRNLISTLLLNGCKITDNSVVRFQNSRMVMFGFEVTI